MLLGGMSLRSRDSATGWLYVFDLSITPCCTGRTPDDPAARSERLVEAGPKLIHGIGGAFATIRAARFGPAKLSIP
jgi:hypothetical protein